MRLAQIKKQFCIVYLLFDIIQNQNTLNITVFWKKIDQTSRSQYLQGLDF